MKIYIIGLLILMATFGLLSFIAFASGSNNVPVLVNVSTDATGYTQGDTVTFTAYWTDDDSGETVKLLIGSSIQFTNCNYTNTTGCRASSLPTTDSPATATMTATSSMNWYAQICDDSNSTEGCDKIVPNLEISSGEYIVNNTANVTISGTYDAGIFGHAEVADLNNDGIDDLLTTSFQGAPYGISNAGEAHIFYGPIPEGEMDITDANVTIHSVVSGERMGSRLTIADFNNDSLNDIALAAFHSDPYGKTDAGKVYIFYNTGPFARELNSTDANLTVYGNTAGDSFGFEISHGDFNNDSISDILIGAPVADPFGRDAAGEAYIIYGSPGLSGEYNASDIVNVTFYGTAAIDTLGRWVTAGDFNNDSIDDVLTSSRFKDTPFVSDAGEVYIFFGENAMPEAINSSKANFTVYGLQAWTETGWMLYAADFNDDGIDDMFISTPVATYHGRSQIGRLFLIYSYLEISGTMNVTAANASFNGNFTEAYAGGGFSYSDFNYDGYMDMVVGEPSADSSGLTNNGNAYVIFGNNSIHGNYNLTQHSNITFMGVTSPADLFWDDIVTGDTNADGLDDIIISGKTTTIDGVANVGQLYIIYASRNLAAGSFTVTAPTTTTSTTSTTTTIAEGGPRPTTVETTETTETTETSTSINEPTSTTSVAMETTEITSTVPEVDEETNENIPENILNAINPNRPITAVNFVTPADDKTITDFKAADEKGISNMTLKCSSGEITANMTELEYIDSVNCENSIVCRWIREMQKKNVSEECRLIVINTDGYASEKAFDIMKIGHPEPVGLTGEKVWFGIRLSRYWWILFLLLLLLIYLVIKVTRHISNKKLGFKFSKIFKKW